MQEDVEIDEFSDEVILLTKTTKEEVQRPTYKDALCLMVTCTPVVELDNTSMPTLNPEGVHQPPTRGINVSTTK